jgi:N-acetyl sugar amidotransferase
MNYIICKRCAIDSTVPDVQFDENGICNHCKVYDEIDGRFCNSVDRDRRLEQTIDKIKQEGRGKEYDCIVGISGGQDSTYTLYMAHKLGLKPLAVHFDNGWNSEKSIRNIKKITSKLNIDLYTYVVDWEEFKDLQISFLKASVSDAEIPTDIAIKEVLYKAAVQNSVKTILYSGSNYRTEGKIPKDWTYMDGRYVKAVQRKFGSIKLKSYPNYTLWSIFYYHFIKKIKAIQLLELIEFNSNDVIKTLVTELEWEYYGGKHYESVYTKFFQSYFLPKKFGIDKRRVHYSALIRSGQNTRADILNKLDQDSYDQKTIKRDLEYVRKKLELSEEEFDIIIDLPMRSYKNYPTYDSTREKLLPIIIFLKKLKLWPRIA